MASLAGVGAKLAFVGSMQMDSQGRIFLMTFREKRKTLQP
jgi:hypothetical protein